jgi:hypothetical protein
MSISQDEFRAALRDVADDIAPDTIPPLSLPAGVIRQPRQRRLLTSLAAAVAVIAVIAASVVLADQAPSPRPSAPAGFAGLRSVPRYYLALLPTRVNGNIYPSADAVIRNTVTGATVATVRPPKPFGRFSFVAAGANDRTCILAAQEGPVGDQSNTPARLYQARFEPASRSVSLTPLPVPETPRNRWLGGFALAPNGAALAIVLEYEGPRGEFETQLRIYSLTDKSLISKVWQGHGFINGDALLGFDKPSISWGRGRTLAFTWGDDDIPANDGIWLLNAATAGGGLLADSRHAVRQRVPGGLYTFPSNAGLLTGSGKVIVDAVSRERLDSRRHYTVLSEFAEFSAATGRQLRVLWPSGAFNEWVQWSNSSGSVLVVAAPVKSGGERGQVAFGVLSGNQFVPIPRAPAAVTPWGAALAF